MLQRRELLAAGASLALGACALPGASGGEPLRRIGFGACCDQKLPQGIWDAVLAWRPDLFLFGGDNVYCQEPFTAERLRDAYAQAERSERLVRLRSTVPHMAIWDDNDYGLNDGGADFAGKQASKDAFLGYWQVPAGDPRRSREGLYDARVFGPTGRRVQVILLDDRWFRSPLRRTDQRNAPGKERYLPDPDPAKTMLGPAQWRWLEQQLREPAEIRLVMSGIQLLAEGHGWERWGNLPLERERLFRVLRETGATGVVLLSGDRHFGAFYREAEGLPHPLTECTASGFTHTFRGVREAGPNRIGDPFTELHFGAVDIDWVGRGLLLNLIDGQARVARSLALSFDELKVPA